MITVEDHVTILSASENLNHAVHGMRRAVFESDLIAEDAVRITIWLCAIEAVADTLGERANVIAETQP